MKTLLRTLLMLVSAVAMGGCMGFGDEEQSVLETVPDEVSYSDIAQITARYCLRCHNSTNPQGDFVADTYEDIYKDRHEAQGEVDQGLMPPLSESPMSKVDRQAFVKWVAQGAPETVDTPEDDTSAE